MVLTHNFSDNYRTYVLKQHDTAEKWSTICGSRQDGYQLNTPNNCLQSKGTHVFWWGCMGLFLCFYLWTSEHQS